MGNFTNTARFVLKEPTATAPTLVYLICRSCTPRLKYSTEVMIEPGLWDATTQRPTAKTKGFDIKEKRRLSEIKTHLDRMADTIDGINSRVKAERITPTKDFYCQSLDDEFRAEPDSPEPEKVGFYDWADKFISEVQSGERTMARNGKKYSDSAAKNYKKIIKHLREFEKETRLKVTFESIDLHFYQKFVNYLNKKNKAVNTIGDLIKNVKVLMRQSMKDGMHTNRAFEDPDFMKPSEEVENIYLTESEISTIYNLDLSHRPGLDRVRDVFVIGCSTGLRFSDLHKVHSDNIFSGGNGTFIRLQTQKTNQPISVPLNTRVIAILEKYDGSGPRVLTNQRMNDHLKEIAELADLNEVVSQTQTKGGKRFARQSKKWQLVTTHTARRSFATNAYLAGVPTIDIMRMTGHKTETSFMKYIKISNDEVAVRMADHPFFKGSSLRIAN